MDCARTRELLQALRRDRLEAASAGEARAHLAGCATCRREAEAEALLDQALRERLPRPAASPALRQRVSEALQAGAEAVRQPSPAAPGHAPARRLALRAAVAALALLSTGLLLERQLAGRREEPAQLTDELVTDHLRQLTSGHPFDVESGANHEVKPWFEGRLDFAPVVPAAGGELRLLGGAVGYVLDRKAAIVAYGLRRHRLTLLAFPAAGLAWPGEGRAAEVGAVQLTARRGFNVLGWRAGELGYALVGDVGAEELRRLAGDLAAETRR